MSSIEAVDVGWRGRFPERPSARWAELSARAQRRAETEISWVDGGVTLGAEFLQALSDGPRSAIRSVSGRTTAHLLAHDGEDVIAEHSALEPELIARVFAEGGGLVLEHAEHDSPLLNLLCGQLAVAGASVVSSVALVGGEPTRVFGKWARRCLVIPVDAPVIVHPEGDAPFDVMPGSVAMADGFPRVGGDSSAMTLFLVEHNFTPALRKSLLLDRAGAHPYLRMDAPLNINDPTEIYGQSDPVAYRELIRAEYDGLLANSDDESLRWWWTLAQPLPPMPTQLAAGEMVRGRFPGGVGMIASEDGTIIRAGGHTLRIPDERLGLFERLLAGEQVVADDDELDPLTLETLASAGVLEVAGAVAASAPASPPVASSVAKNLQLSQSGNGNEASTRVQILVEGAPLEIALGDDLADEARTLIMGVVSGYVAASELPVASMLVTGGGPFGVVGTTLAEQPVAVEIATPPYGTLFSTDRADHVAYAVSDWIDRTALLYGHHDRVRLHASAFVDDERVWVVAGESNAGKTSLALDAIQRGGAYITEERVTVHRAEGVPMITGLSQAIRMRSEEQLASMHAVAQIESGQSSDGFRWLLFGEAIEELAPICREPVVATDLLLLSAEPAEAVTHGWVVRALAELSHNLSLAGVGGLVDLARLACNCRVFVRPERSMFSVGELDEPDLVPAEFEPELLAQSGDTNSTDRIAPDVATLTLGDDLLLWIPRSTSVLLQLRESGADWWRDLAAGRPVSSEGEFEGFVQTLRSAGALE